jgi:tripartite-type tricarboxylate transporter receptor subunit TctC
MLKVKPIGAALLGLAAAALGSHVAAADAYPTASIRLVVPFAAGGGTDAVARPIAHVLSARLGQPVVVENRPGAGGSLGSLAVAQAAPDGYSLLLGSNGTMVLNPALYPKLKYQTERDFVPVAGIVSVPYLIATNPQFPATNIDSLLTIAKQKQVTFASPGNGTTNHLVGVLLKSMAGVDMTHVPYRGASPAVNDVISGQVNFLSGDLGTLLPMVSNGMLRAIAVTGPQRVAILPNVPTVAETLPGFEATGWFGVFAPKGTPTVVVEKLTSEIAEALKDSRVAQQLHNLGGTPMPLKPSELTRLVAAESVKWRNIMKENKIAADVLQ